MQSPTSFVPHLVLLTLILIWSVSFVVSKYTLGSLTPPSLVAVRFWLATLVMLPFLRRGFVSDLRRARGPGLAAGTALGLGFHLQMAGMTGTSAAMGGLLAGLIVPLVALGGFLFLGARLRPQSLLGLGCAIAGIAVICLPPGGVAPERANSLHGILLQIGSSTCYAGHVLLLTRYGRTAPIIAFTLWQLVIVAAAGSVIALATGQIAAEPGTDVAWTGELLLALAFLGVVASGLAIMVQGMVQHRIAPTQLALLFALQPLFAALCGVLLQGDQLGLWQVSGGALIIAGVVVTGLDR